LRRRRYFDYRGRRFEETGGEQLNVLARDDLTGSAWLRDWVSGDTCSLLAGLTMA
jgi:hypothetical protein